MRTVATRMGGKAVDDVASIIKQFRTVHADAVIEILTYAAWEEAAQKRTLKWQSERRIPLQDAAVCYAQIVDGYNEFQPSMIAALNAAFADCGVEVPPARE